VGDQGRRETMALVAAGTLAHDGEIAADYSSAVNLTSPFYFLH
jgi:hypothetical protein